MLLIAQEAGLLNIIKSDDTKMLGLNNAFIGA